MENLPTTIEKNCILGPPPWPRPFLSLASRGPVLESRSLALASNVVSLTPPLVSTLSMARDLGQLSPSPFYHCVLTRLLTFILCLGEIVLLTNWGPIGFLISMPFFIWCMANKGLRLSNLVTAFSMALGSGLRCLPIDASVLR